MVEIRNISRNDINNTIIKQTIIDLKNQGVKLKFYTELNNIKFIESIRRKLCD